MASNEDDFPVLTSVRVVCRECLSFRELKHINVLTNEFLRMGSIREACLDGSLRLMRLVAARDTKSHWGDVAKIAAKRGHKHILQWLSEFHADRCDWDDVLDLAAFYGRLPVVKWLHTNRQDKCTTKAMDKAAALGHLDVVKWLHTNRSEGCSTEAMDRAAFFGHLDVVKWLHNNRTEGCTERAMTWTVMYGHLDQVKWLHANTTKGCSPYIMDEVTDLEMIKWLHENLSGGELCSTRAMDKAAELGRLDLVNWLHENRTEGYSIHAIELAARNGHLDVVKWLFHHEGDKRRYRCQGLRINCFSLHLMYCFQGLNDFILKMARKSGQQHVVQWVESLDEPETTTELWCVVSRE